MAEAASQEPVITMWSKEFTYDRWMKSKGIPIHKGYFIPDLRTVGQAVARLKVDKAHFARFPAA